MPLVPKYLKKVVDNELLKEELVQLFSQAIRTVSHYERWTAGYYKEADTSIVYDWWDRYLDNAINDCVLIEMLRERLYDEDINNFLEDIHDKYLADIDYKPIEEGGGWCGMKFAE